VFDRHAHKPGQVVHVQLGHQVGPVLFDRLHPDLQGALPTGVAPARAAIWLAEGRIPPGVHPPETVLDPEPFFKEREQREIYTQVSVTEFL
jgi:hypothetical protein